MAQAVMSQSLQECDPTLYNWICCEQQRQLEGIELIASENFTSAAVLDCLGSCLTNKYSEGQPKSRYYGGNEYIDEIELLCKERCLKAFGLDSSEWHVNVQPYSGSPANFAVYTGLLKPHDRIMGLHLFAGGHLTHGFYTAKKRVSASSIYFESLPYDVDRESGLVDFPTFRKNALLYRPKLIICGASSYPRFIEYEEFRKVADECNAILMCDMAHVAGLIAGKAHPSPFPYCDIVTSTCHKTLRGPRAGVIFVNFKRLGQNAISQIDSAVFPGLQGGPHNHQIAGIATQMLQVLSPEWQVYCDRIVKNAKALAKYLTDRGERVVSGGTDNHLVVWDLNKHNLNGIKMEKVCEKVGISLNKNSIPGDASAWVPGGVRIGTSAMTSRGCTEKDMEFIGSVLLDSLAIAKKIQARVSGTKTGDFTALFDEESKSFDEVGRAIKEFARKLFYPQYNFASERPQLKN